MPAYALNVSVTLPAGTPAPVVETAEGDFVTIPIRHGAYLTSHWTIPLRDAIESGIIRATELVR